MLAWIVTNTNAINAISTVISALTSIFLVWLTFALKKYTAVQAKAAEESVNLTSALKDIETSRDAAQDPRVFIWFSGYNAFDGTGSFVVQNSGQKKLFLRSLKISSPGMDVAFFDLEVDPKKKEGITSCGELNDLVITPEKIERFFFRFKNGNGQHFELLAQLYVGPPVRIKIDPSRLNGYELRAAKSTELVGKDNAD